MGIVANARTCQRTSSRRGFIALPCHRAEGHGCTLSQDAAFCGNKTGLLCGDDAESPQCAERSILALPRVA